MPLPGFVFWGLVGLVCGSVCVTSQFPAIVADAGSTGTRVYAFHLTAEGTHVDISLLGKITPGLSTFAQQNQVAEVAEQLAPLITRGCSRFGVKGVPVHILGTGGVRSLSDELQAKLWSDLRTQLQLRTSEFAGEFFLDAIHGTQEAFYGLVSVRHLTGGNFGVLDLGGSSAEIAHAGPDDAAGTHDDLLETHAQLGTEKIRVQASDACSFHAASGAAEAGAAGSQCIARIRSILGTHKIERTLFDNQHHFFAVSAFAYSLDFAFWLFAQQPSPGRQHRAEAEAEAVSGFLAEYPRPSLAAIRGLCHGLCAQPLDVPLFSQHPRTNAREAEGRCFDVCYVAELLHAFGVQEHERRITFAISVEDREIEWTLGYYLAHVVQPTLKAKAKATATAASASASAPASPGDRNDSDRNEL